MEIKILGTGCPKCKTLEKITREVVEQNGFNATITKVEDIVDIMMYNVMSTPALVVNEKVEILIKQKTYLMKKLILLSLVLVMALGSFSCSAQTPKKEDKTSNVSGNVEAYYFHFSARCVTCKSVEAEAKNDLESLYNGKITLKAVNLDDASGKALAEKLQVSGQTLLLVKGNTKINITNEGFMYARSNPEKFKAVIKEKVDGLLKS
jgi:small redox-active disulfide protein 2